MGSLANETYHVRNPTVHGAQAERESAQLEESVLLSWANTLESECGPFTGAQNAKRQHLLRAIYGGIDQARVIIEANGGTPRY